MATLTIGLEGEIRLPDEVRHRYGLVPDVSIRIIETRSGILLVPLSDAPMSPELAEELEEWQSLGAEAWSLFPYEDSKT